MPRHVACACRELHGILDAAQAVVTCSLPTTAQKAAALPAGPRFAPVERVVDSKRWQELFVTDRISPTSQKTHMRRSETFVEAYVTAARCLDEDMRAVIASWEAVRGMKMQTLVWITRWVLASLKWH